MTEPDFSNRKTLTYDDDSQDGLPHSSFEESRTIAPDTTDDIGVSVFDSVVKGNLADSKSGIPGFDISDSAMDNSVIEIDPETDATSETSGTVKTEVVEEPTQSSSLSETVVVKSEPCDSSDPVFGDKQEVSVKTEPLSQEEYTPMDTDETDTAAIASEISEATEVKQEPIDTQGEDLVNKTVTVDVQVKVEPNAETNEVKVEVSNTEADFHMADDTEKDKQIVTESVESAMEHEPENSTTSVHESETMGDAIEKTEDVEHGELKETDMTEMEHSEAEEPSRESSMTPNPIESVDEHISADSTNDEMSRDSIADSVSIGKNSQDSEEASEEVKERHQETFEMAHSGLTVHSTEAISYARSPIRTLGHVKVAAPTDILDISEEVLEIGSEASTPTRDELPSPQPDES